MSNIREPANIPDFVLDHVRRYVGSEGADGHLWDSTGYGDHGMIPSLLLTTTGCKTGELMRVPLIYAEVEGNFVVVASRGGAPTNPAWYLNLSNNPIVEVQVIAEKFRASARTAHAEEREQLWEIMSVIYPTYDELKKATDRQIPVVVLSPVHK